MSPTSTAPTASPILSSILEGRPEWDISISSCRVSAPDPGTEAEDMYEIVFRSRQNSATTQTWITGNLREAVDLAHMQNQIYMTMVGEENWG